MWTSKLAYLANIFSRLNDHNSSLQSYCINIFSVYNKTNNFKEMVKKKYENELRNRSLVIYSFIPSFIFILFLTTNMISKFYTLKDSRESRKGRCKKTSNVETCKNKARKKVKEKDYGACLRHQKNKREKKEKKFKLNSIQV